MAIVEPSAENIAKAALALQQGGVVAFPTETVYGLGADAGNGAAVQKIYALKGRPAFNPLIVHVDSFEGLLAVSSIKAQSQALLWLEKLKGLWPGPLSVVLPKAASICNEATAGLNSVAVRIPDHAVALSLIKAAACPIAAPSANISSNVSSTTAFHVETVFGSRVDVILDGGPCRVGLESTIVSLLGTRPEILRPGAVTMDQLQALLGALDVKYRDSAQVLAPGMLKRHYAPKTPLLLRPHYRASGTVKRLGLIAFGPQKAEDIIDFVKVSTLSSSGNLEEIAAGLFAALHEFDGLGLDLIVVDTCEERGLGAAIMDRLLRATTHDK